MRLAIGDRVTPTASAFGVIAGRTYEVIVEWGPFVAVRDVETDERFGYSESSLDGTPQGNILASRFRAVA